MATSMENFLSCIVCSERFLDPQLLPCQHTFCENCLYGITDDGEIECPKCHEVCPLEDVEPDYRMCMFLDEFSNESADSKGAKPGTERHEKNQGGEKLCELCEEKSVAHWCTDCEQWLCEHCKKIHLKSKATKNHTFTSLCANNGECKAAIQHTIQNVDIKTEVCETGDSSRSDSAEVRTSVYHTQ